VRQDIAQWLCCSGEVKLSLGLSRAAENDEEDAVKRLDIMEKRRVIEQIDLNAIAFEKQMVRAVPLTKRIM